MYKISKDVIAVDAFHGRSERGVRQELYAHFNLIAMTRLFTNRGDGVLDDAHEGDLPKRRTNFSNALAMLAGSLEEMILGQAAALADAVSRVADSVLAARALFPAPLEKARREVGPQPEAGRVASRPSGPGRGEAAPELVRHLKEMTPNR